MARVAPRPSRCATIVSLSVKLRLSCGPVGPIEMHNWNQIVARHHSAAHRDDGYELVTRPGATGALIQETGAALGVAFPDEFIALYRVFDGIGIRNDDHGEEVLWFFQPLAQLQEFVATTRGWFRETHPELAARFFPFLDWANGDGMGYLTDESGSVLPGLFTFEHECYEFDEEQEPDEFLVSIPVTIEQFLDAV